jgi:hypothetical protein
MKDNAETKLDRVIRIAIGIVSLAIGWGGVVGGFWGVFFKVAGFLPLLNGLIPEYRLVVAQLSQRR